MAERCRKPSLLLYVLGGLGGLLDELESTESFFATGGTGLLGTGRELEEVSVTEILLAIVAPLFGGGGLDGFEIPPLLLILGSKANSVHA